MQSQAEKLDGGGAEKKGWVIFVGLARAVRIAGKCVSLLESCGPCCAESPALTVVWLFSFCTHWGLYVCGAGGCLALMTRQGGVGGDPENNDTKLMTQSVFVL